MKKYVIILLLLIALGMGLAVLFVSQDEKLDDMVFGQTTESIRNLQAVDKNLQVMLNESRLRPGFDGERLWALYYQISDEFDNLRYEALFEEIEQSSALSLAVAEFETQFGQQETLLEDYINGNAVLGDGFNTVTPLGTQLQATPELLAVSDLLESLASNKTRLLLLALGQEPKGPLLVIPAGVTLTQATAKRLAQYHAGIENINRYRPSVAANYAKLSELNTGSLLDRIEREYVAYHRQAIGGSELFRNALIAYGVLLFGALLVFGYQIRKSYVSLEQQVVDRTAEINNAYQDLKESQEQLIQSEKMASLGQMVAGVAHEINTPLGYVTSNVDTLKLNLSDLNQVVSKLDTLMAAAVKPKRDSKEISQKLVQTLKSYRAVEAPELIVESAQLLSDGAFGLAEIGKLVTSLKDFARLDRQESDHEDIHTCLENSLTIASNQLRSYQVSVERKFAEVPLIRCSPSKLNQVFLNIITNACQAIGEQGGKLRISTSASADRLRVAFKDTGAGRAKPLKSKCSILFSRLKTSVRAPAWVCRLPIK